MGLGGADRSFQMATLRAGGKAITPEELEERVGALIADLSKAGVPLQRSIAASEAMFDILFPPTVRPILRADQNITIVPHASLHLLPFHAL